MVVHYEPTNGMLATASKVSWSVLPRVFRRPVFWLSVCIYLVTNLAYRLGLLPDADDDMSFFGVDMQYVKVLTHMTVYLQVFYLHGCFNSHINSYTLGRELMGNLYNFLFELKLFTSPEFTAHINLATRYLIGGVVLCFNDAVHTEFTSLDKMWKMNLLTPKECRFLKTIIRNNLRTQILMHWAADVAYRAAELADAGYSTRTRLVNTVLEARQRQQTMLDWLEFPASFPYFHLIVMTVPLCTITWAYQMALTNSLLAPFVFLSSTAALIGMLELSIALVNPYGFDDEDVPLAEWITSFIREACVLAGAAYPGLRLGFESELKSESNSDENWLRTFVHEYDSTEGMARLLPKGPLNMASDTHARLSNKIPRAEENFAAGPSIGGAFTADGYQLLPTGTAEGDENTEGDDDYYNYQSTG